MRDHLVEHARTFIEYGDELPPHEVNYEQSMVARCSSCSSRRTGSRPAEIDAAELTRRLPG